VNCTFKLDLGKLPSQLFASSLYDCCVGKADAVKGEFHLGYRTFTVQRVPTSTRMGIVGKVSDLTLGRSFRQAHQEQSPAVLVDAYPLSCFRVSRLYLRYTSGKSAPTTNNLHAWGLWFADTRTILARQSPAVYVIVKLLWSFTTLESRYTCIGLWGYSEGTTQCSCNGFFCF